MYVPSLNEICESIFELSCTEVKAYDDGTADTKPIHPQLSSGDIMNTTLISLVFEFLLNTEHVYKNTNINLVKV